MTNIQASFGRAFAIVAIVAGAGACTSLGPMPAVTGQSVLPTQRPGVEAQVAAVPGYFLSAAVQDDEKGSPVQQASLMGEPGELIGLPGLSGGGRVIGGADAGTYVEPMVRYRTALDDKGVFAGGVIVYGSHQRGASQGASVEATRGGAEVGFDARATPESKWVEVHVAGSVGLMGLDAKGEYCLDSAGRWGVDCADPPVNLTKATADGFFPSAGGAIGLDFGRHLDGILHGGRLAVHGAVGKMPRVERAEQRDSKTFTSAGLSLTLGMGAVE
jgi:hypothetical protein